MTQTSSSEQSKHYHRTVCSPRDSGKKEDQAAELSTRVANRDRPGTTVTASFVYLLLQCGLLIHHRSQV